jgi:hypothetical protein
MRQSAKRPCTGCRGFCPMRRIREAVADPLGYPLRVHNNFTSLPHWAEPLGSCTDVLHFVQYTWVTTIGSRQSIFSVPRSSQLLHFESVEINYSLPMATHQTKTNITRLQPKPSLINSSLPTRVSQGVNKWLQGPLRRSARLLDKTSHIHEQTRSKDRSAERKPPFPSPTSGSPVKKAWHFSSCYAM